MVDFTFFSLFFECSFSDQKRLISIRKFNLEFDGIVRWQKEQSHWKVINLVGNKCCAMMNFQSKNKAIFQFSTLEFSIIHKTMFYSKICVNLSLFLRTFFRSHSSSKSVHNVTNGHKLLTLTLIISKIFGWKNVAIKS